MGLRNASLIATIVATGMLAGCADDNPGAPQPIPAGGPLSGTVERGNGTPAAGASIIADPIGPASQAFTATTDALGQFSIAVVPSGSYRVSAFVAPDTGGSATVSVPANPVTIHVSAPGYVRGIATRTGVTDQRGIFVYSTFPFGIGVTDSVGGYVRWLPPGHWSLLGFQPGYTSTIVSVDILAPGDTVTAPPLSLTPERGP